MHRFLTCLSLLGRRQRQQQQQRHHSHVAACAHAAATAPTPVTGRSQGPELRRLCRRQDRGLRWPRALRGVSGPRSFFRPELPFHPACKLKPADVHTAARRTRRQQQRESPAPMPASAAGRMRNLASVPPPGPATATQSATAASAPDCRAPTTCSTCRPGHGGRTSGCRSRCSRDFSERVRLPC